jgi:hypothetical protein
MQSSGKLIEKLIAAKSLNTFFKNQVFATLRQS